jgi:hypothetical protein
VYLVTGGARGSETAEPKVVPIGITDGVWTVLKSDALAAGTEVVVEQHEEEKKRFGLF